MPYNNSAHSATQQRKVSVIVICHRLVAHTHNARISRDSELRSGFQSTRQPK